MKKIISITLFLSAVLLLARKAMKINMPNIWIDLSLMTIVSFGCISLLVIKFREINRKAFLDSEDFKIRHEK